ncbi:LOW QUALITY PROTEIN: putative reverse transcriptase [Babesia divergens]|uniref:Reverse transcriptase n=1 Tax=Babesia divergens TaxID=32595 RepID=A0AAD9GFA7_BABDI|nr:LOW QUALITY PROTEIN: putative reverse transcriptase [Babesia divergens]
MAESTAEYGENIKNNIANVDRMPHLLDCYRREVDESAITADMQKYQDYITERPPPISEAGFPSIDEFKETIKMLGNWKSPGPERVYNYYIKYMIAIHEELYDAVKNMEAGRGWFYEGATYLFSKKAKPTSAGHYRPITCMSTLYKLTTRCITEVVKREVEARLFGRNGWICLQQTYDFVMRELGIEVMEEIEGWVQGMSRRTIPSLPDPGPMPMAAAPAVLCET